MGLSDGRKSFPIDFAVLIQYRSVTATQVAVAITLNAKASSLKILQRRQQLSKVRIGSPKRARNEEVCAHQSPKVI